MPLLFKNGKLVVNDLDQLVFSDDPSSCRCCPGAATCDCPVDADFTSPKYVDDVYVSVSDLPDTYQESKYIRYFVQYQNGQIVDQIDEAYVTISGISALNGTYPGELKQWNSESDCVLPVPLPTCPYDTLVSCNWRVPAAYVSVTGTLRLRQYRYIRLPNDVATDSDNTYYLTGNAFALTNQKGRILIRCCVREGSYSGTVIGAFVIEANKGFDGQQPEIMAYSTRTSSTLTRSGCELEWTTGANFGQTPVYFPSMLVHQNIIDFIDICVTPSDPVGYTYFPFYTCNNVGESDVLYSLIGCGDSGSATEVVLNGLATVTTTWSYSISQFDYNVDWTITYNPP